MKIERISENKIKVTMTNDELIQWDVSFDSLSYNSPEVQDLFWMLMKQAEDETGFFAGDSQLIVEAMPYRNDSFVMIITKTDNDGENAIHKYIKPRIKRETRPKKAYKETSLVIEFDSFDDMIDGCKAIENRFAGTSALYKFNGKEYLFLNVVNEFLAGDIEIMIADFGTVIGSAFIKEGELKEHGELLIEYDAISSICTYF